ncbi:VOC family protein [Nocardioides szechwanensis]|nr:VOC family protein [Nocardioides szechwanensis]
MTVSLAMITFDSPDPVPLAEWWAAQTGAEVGDTNGGWFVTISGGSIPVRLGFQKVSDPTPGKNKVHLDLLASDIDAEAGRLVEAGATEVARQDMGGFRWITLADPQGNQFCVAAG